ncbi:Uncharacterized protein FWK35_00032743 [Aphis craccivora]|uniref:Uncharacterized protein n=1 Tax=Aphis craccivora TaxID=307492 RepID=A0A6G0VQE9_APHCR|nr:Uncharacterized protein FWK35_00032743 [Aphis craccivora]
MVELTESDVKNYKRVDDLYEIFRNLLICSDWLILGRVLHEYRFGERDGVFQCFAVLPSTRAVYHFNNSERSEECIDFTIISSRNNAPISNYGGGLRCKSEYPWCIIEFSKKLRKTNKK